MDLTKLLVTLSAHSLLPRGLQLGSPEVDKLLEARGGQLSPLPFSQVRWYQRDIERAIYEADQGDLSRAARLWQASQTDGVFSGLLSTRTDGLVRLPKKFTGSSDLTDELRSTDSSVRPLFDEMFPPAELAKFAADSVGLGVSVGELRPVPGRDYPVFICLDPQFLRFHHAENRWYYVSTVGVLPITPGDGRWLLNLSGGRVSPWLAGIWQAVGSAWIRKQHAELHSQNWEAKLANPARVAVSPQGASEQQKQSWFRAVMAWGINTVFGMTPGYDVKLLESNGRGYDAFDRTIKRAEREMIISVSGQEVTSDGGAGFTNGDVFRRIQIDLIKSTADSLAYTINTQGIPAWVVARFGEDRLFDSPIVEWDVTPPKDRNNEAQALSSFGAALNTLTKALRDYGLQPDVQALLARFNIPSNALDKSLSEARIELTPSDTAAIVRVNEGRTALGLADLEDSEGTLFISEFKERHASEDKENNP